PGAKIGTHTVTITTARTVTDEEGNMTATPEEVPSRYNFESELVEEVKPGKNTIDFELSSDS
ncbi:MAG: carboxypeptidase regulatory-like domain-containing protein, partial [Pirellulaceae bacterium]